MIKNIYEKFRVNMIMVKESKLSSKVRNTNNACFHHSYSILHWKFKPEQDTETKDNQISKEVVNLSLFTLDMTLYT